MKNFLFVIVCLFVLCVSAQEKKLLTSKEYQDNLNKEFADSISSPLEKEDLKHFEKLDFYPISDKFIVEATFVKIKKGKVFEMRTTTSRKPKYKVYGLLRFQIDGKDFELFVYQSQDLMKKKEYEDYLFLPFTDYTNGVESYGAGRYIDFTIPKTSKVIIDFNKAYNPYCAYNKKYSCPIVPEENDLKIEIKAGVKKYHD
ncbi:DUF1684 domain-containing protein [Flavobacterium amnicola]|uniref:DUF1684 domain-containing protein n=1 Tax=Flavobacterium amnicola TaxID=2506422 RepID=A0A4Q1K3C3_9FLAO|nr:DUF1684 domain-containing protein [Flavobacterium amnicola]RXR19324.1 DUF1684 domain-containing protein [Flavobacterium amnicola]